MLGTFIIVLRELIEAGLIVGIALAATRGIVGRTAWIGGGVLSGTLGAALVAGFTSVISSWFDGVGQEMFNVAVLLIAVAMLTWHNVWMGQHGKELAVQMRSAGHRVASGEQTLLALAVVVAVAILREGSEVVLFLYGIAASRQNTWAEMLGGSLLGLVAGIGISALMYAGLLRVPLHQFFKVTSMLVALLAAGLLAQATSFLEQAGIITALTTPLWDSSSLLAQDSLLGKALHTLVGYMDHPTGAELLAYGGYLLLTWILIVRVNAKAVAV